MKIGIRQVLIALSIIFFSLVVVGCNSSTETTQSNGGNDGKSETKETSTTEGSSTDYPKKDIEFVVGYNPGGGYSDYAQGLAPFLEKHLPNDATVVVRHMPGAGSVTATNYIHKAKPDGYTIGIYNVNGLAPTQVSQDVAYDLNEVTWLGRVDAGNNVALVKKGGPYKSLEDFKGTDKKYVVATKGLQSQDTIAGAVTLHELGVKWEPLNHEGTGEAALAVIRGDADLMFGSYESVRQYIDSGDLVPVLYYDTEPRPEFSDVPLPSDLGLSKEINTGFNSQRLIGAPPGLPDDVKQILVKAIKEAIHDPEFIEQMEKMERSLSYMDEKGSAELVKAALSGFEKFKPVVDELYAR